MGILEPMSNESSEWVSLSAGAMTVEINPLGAQLSTLRNRGNDLLWDGDPTIWNGRAPLLFPIIGALAQGCYRVGGRTFHLPRHGFARGRRFDLVESTPSSAMFRLTADAASLAIYPFRFELNVRFSLVDNTLSVVTEVRNSDDQDMPASIGYHPAFRWPLPFGKARESHAIEFADDEPDPCRRLDAQGLLTAELHPTPISNRRLELTDVLFENDVIIFDQIKSRSVTYGAVGAPSIRVSFPDALYLALWSKPGAKFVCVEPWHGVADPEGFSGNLATKPGIRVLSPGSAMLLSMEITVLDD